MEDFSLLDASTSLVTSGFDLSDNRSAGDGGIRFNSPNKYTYIECTGGAWRGQPTQVRRPSQLLCANVDHHGTGCGQNLLDSRRHLEMLNPDYDYVQGMTLTWPR
ncbi:MAG: hypothetical protein R2857_00150 [Vampirovibrionales bacterium]